MSVSLAGVIWGTIGPGVQLINELSGLSPWTISAYRAVAAVAVLLIVSLVMGRLAHPGPWLAVTGAA